VTYYSSVGDWEMSWGLLSDLADRFDSVHPQLPHTVDVYKAQHAAMSLGVILGLHLSRSVVAKRLEILRRGIECVPLSASERGHIESLPPDLAAKRDFVLQSGREHRNLYPAIQRSIFIFDGILPSQTPIIKLLGMFVRNEATKYQDRLYALIGLASDINLEEFPPDYEETVDQTKCLIFLQHPSSSLIDVRHSWNAGFILLANHGPKSCAGRSLPTIEIGVPVKKSSC